MPSAPLWVRNASRPRIGRAGANVALRLTAGSVLMMPMQLGPIIRTPAARIFATSSAWSALPASPHSPKPALITTSALTPFAMHSSATASTCAAGTTMTARSTGPGIAATDVAAASPATVPPAGFTGMSVPVKPDSRRLRTISDPIRPGSRLAPTTATARGLKNRRSDAAAASRDRAAEASTCRAVAASDSVTCQVPCSISRVSAEPGLDEHVHHQAILAADERLERRQPARARDLRQAFEQASGEAAALEVVSDREFDFRPLRPFGIAVIAANADQVAVALRDQHDLPRLIDVHAGAGAGQVEARRHQKAVVEAVGRQLLEETQRRGRVVRARGAQPDRGAVAQHDVGFEVLQSGWSHAFWTASARPSSTTRNS